jgi:F-type H+-transporting ATPase subunit b
LKLKYLSLLLLPALALASEQGAEHGGTDIFWRLINFLIFFGILYYLLADKIKAYFKGREDGIAGRLSEVQEKLKEAKAAKEAAVQKAKDAEATAADYVEAAKKEAELMVEKINQTLAHDKEILEKSFQDRVEVEAKKMKKEVVDEVLEEMFSSKSANISNDDLLNIIKKKVA